MLAKSYEQALSDSAIAFCTHVSPLLTALLGCEVVIVEAEATDRMRRMLDQVAGIDAWVRARAGVRGVGSRIQEGPKNWETFSVRLSRDSGASTEYSKRKEAIEKGWLYPYYAVQAYINGGRLLGCAVARTDHLIRLVDDGVGRLRRTGAEQKGQAEFLAVPWQAFKDRGLPICIWGADGRRLP